MHAEYQLENAVKINDQVTDWVVLLRYYKFRYCPNNRNLTHCQYFDYPIIGIDT